MKPPEHESGATVASDAAIEDPSRPKPECLGPSVKFVPIHSIGQLSENWEVYRRPGDDDGAFRQLRESIAENGILSPLEVSGDGYVLSGHRRLAAATAEGLAFVPVIERPDIHVGEMTPGERITFLTARNAGQRIKSDAELILEAAARVDPDEAVRAAEDAKAQVLDEAKSSAPEVFTIGKINRSDPTGARAEMLKAVIGILRDYRRKFGAVPMSGRGIHYQLLSRKVRTSSGKAGRLYDNTEQSSKLLSKLLTDARSFGIIPEDWIDDPTRPSDFYIPQDIGEYVAQESSRFLRHFFSNVHREQANHVELLLEKNTLFPLIRKHVAAVLRLPLTSMRGYGSYPASRDIAARFRRSGKDNLVVVYISDLDPEGMNMPAAFKKYLRYDFNVEATVLRAAVTPDQVERYALEPDANVKSGTAEKRGSSRAAAFIAEHGDQCWELDSMPPQSLIDEVLNVSKSCLDIDVLNTAMERERQADIKLARLNAAVAELIRTKGSAIMGGAL
jgi:hypothetical protein